jgi:hypothetical protein
MPVGQFEDHIPLKGAQSARIAAVGGAYEFPRYVLWTLRVCSHISGQQSNGDGQRNH